jgi:hypothetical protein
VQISRLGGVHIIGLDIVLLYGESSRCIPLLA